MYIYHHWGSISISLIPKIRNWLTVTPDIHRTWMIYRVGVTVQIMSNKKSYRKTIYIYWIPMIMVYTQTPRKNHKYAPSVIKGF